MIFLRDDGHHEPDETPNFVPAPGPNTKFLFDTNDRLRKSDIAVTHSKQTTGPFSIRYKLTLRNTPSLSIKIANSAVRIPRA